MSTKAQEAYERVANLVINLSKNYVTCVWLNDVTQIAQIDQKIVSISLDAAQKLMDALPENSPLPFYQLVDHILIELWLGFNSLSRRGTTMSSTDYRSNWLNLARSMALIIFVFENWVENPKTGNHLSLLKLRAARNTACMLNYHNLANNELEAVALGNNDFYYIPVLNSSVNLVLTDFSGNNQTNIMLKNLNFPVDEKFIDPPMTEDGNFHVE